MTKTRETQARTIYVFDAYCGWCYAFNPVISRLNNTFREKIRFNAISGGLILGDRVGPLAAMSAYIRSAIPRVESLSGVTFSEPYKNRLVEGNVVQDSLLPARAFAVLRTLSDADEIELAEDLQFLWFGEGKDYHDPETYNSLLEKHKVDKQLFTQKYSAPESLKAAQADFSAAAEHGVSGFPALVYENATTGGMFSSGYRDYEILADIIEKLLADPPA